MSLGRKKATMKIRGTLMGVFLLYFLCSVFPSIRSFSHERSVIGKKDVFHLTKSKQELSVRVGGRKQTGARVGGCVRGCLST